MGGVLPVTSLSLPFGHRQICGNVVGFVFQSLLELILSLLLPAIVIEGFGQILSGKRIERIDAEDFAIGGGDLRMDCAVYLSVAREAENQSLLHVTPRLLDVGVPRYGS